jgi:lysozyme family protein
MNLTQGMKKDYSSLWSTCAVRGDRRASADAIVDRIAANKKRYEAAGKPNGVPWYVVGIIHMLEGGGNFSKHLHNGDPLTARTVHVPAGRPKSGKPPFTWEASAADALVSNGLSRWTDWTLPGTLFALERYNGFGYRPIGIPSPYLWSFSNHYTKGKFTSDGHFSASAVSAQCGAAVILNRMVARGLATIEGAEPTLRRGSRGADVGAFKKQLKKWYDKALPGEWKTLGVAETDFFGAPLEQAVRRFQTRSRLRVSGEVDPATRATLKRKLAS